MTNKRPLWAPWRIDFIRSKKPDSCFLCEKAKAEAFELEENNIIHRGKTCYLLMNTYPYNSGHLMVAPYRHVAELELMSAQERLELMDLAVLGQKILTKVMNPEGFNLGLNLGEAAGAGVAEHLHLHVVPRWNGDNNFMAVIAGNRVVPESLKQTTQLLRNALKELNDE